MLHRIADWNEFQLPYLPTIRSLPPRFFNNCFELSFSNASHGLLDLSSWKLPALDALNANDFLLCWRPGGYVRMSPTRMLKSSFLSYSRRESKGSNG